MLKALHTPEDQWRIIHPNVGQDLRATLSGFQRYAREQHIDLLVANSPSAADEMVADFAPDIAFVCGWYWLLKPSVLARIPMGVWGAHNSLLPKYRGASPLVWAIIRGDQYVGSTVFQFRAGMDDGPILHQVRSELRQSDHIADILERIEKALIDELPIKWRALLHGEAQLVEQEGLATYCGQRIPADGEINWRCSATQVRDFIRAQSRPYPGAFTGVGNAKVVVWDAEVEVRPWYGIPGQVLVRATDYVLIACGDDTSIRLTKVEVDGNSIEPRKAFASIALRLG